MLRVGEEGRMKEEERRRSREKRKREKEKEKGEEKERKRKRERCGGGRGDDRGTGRARAEVGRHTVASARSNARGTRKSIETGRMIGTGVGTAVRRERFRDIGSSDGKKILEMIGAQRRKWF
jgi:hypothetical protein